MKITLKLFASLAVHLPAGARSSHKVDLDVDPGITVLDVIRRQGRNSAVNNGKRPRRREHRGL